MLRIDGITVYVTRKKIKHMYLSVRSQDKQVRISVPVHLSNQEIILFIKSKHNWIDKQRKKFAAHPLSPQSRYVSGEQIYVWGRAYRLEIAPCATGQTARLCAETLILPVGNATLQKRDAALNAWYRDQLNQRLFELVRLWEPIIGVKASGVRIKNMKTKWGTCNIRDKRIWLNLQLAKKPIECVEYVVVHELVHLLEARHNAVFWSYMDQFLPNWKALKKQLNS